MAIRKARVFAGLFTDVGITGKLVRLSPARCRRFELSQSTSST